MTQIQRSVVAPPPAPPPPITGKETAGKEQPPPPVPSAPRWGVWANGWGDWVHVNSTASAQGYHFTTGGMSAGIDYLVTDQLAVGLFGGYSHTWVNFKPSGSADVDTGRGGLYATYFNPTGWWVNAAVGGEATPTQPADRHCLDWPTEARMATKFRPSAKPDTTSIAGTWSGDRLWPCSTLTPMSQALANMDP